MDGGVRDFLNADAAAGHDVVLAISCGLLDIPSDFGMPAMELVMGATRARLEALRDGGARVATIVPNEEMLQLSGWGQNLMDVSRANAAYRPARARGKPKLVTSGRSGQQARTKRWTDDGFDTYRCR